MDKIDNRDEVIQLKAELAKLRKENERLENRFGLVWKDVPEKFIKYVSDEEVLYGESLYILILDDVKANGKTLKVEVNGVSHNLVRQSDSYLFKSKETDEVFLLHSNKLYKFEEETYEQYVPILEDKGGDFFIGDNDKNVLIEGDNYYALQMLQYTHRGKVDVICIDPPYNTGNKDFFYNDSFIKEEDGDRHSSWLSFMQKRIMLAKNLLSDTGIIFINIDECEIDRLSLLMKQVFGEHNYIETFIWEKNSTKNNSKTTSTNHEYIICFSKDRRSIENVPFFKIKKDGYNEVLKILESGIESKLNQLDLQYKIRDFYKSRPDLKGISQYKYVDEKYNLYRKSDASAPSKMESQYDVVHPITGKICSKPKNRGWAYSEEKMAKLIEQDRICFGDDEKTVPSFKRLLVDMEFEVQKSLIRNTSEGKKEIISLFGKEIFNNPKPSSLIKQLISLNSIRDITILDFFAGSGTTGHAVWDLNKEDGGNRKFILVTNNENNICEDVTFERLKRANSEEHGGYNESLRYLKIKHVDATDVSLETSEGTFEALKNLINLKYGSFTTIKDDENCFSNGKISILKKKTRIKSFIKEFSDSEYLGILCNEDHTFNKFKEEALKTHPDKKIIKLSSDYMKEIKEVLIGEDHE